MRNKMQVTRCKKLFFVVGAVLASCFLFLASAQAETITITSDACAYATEYQKDPGVDYQPGVDAEGNAVAPADLDGQGGFMPWPQDITIPLALDLQNSLHLSSKLTGTDALIGTVEYKNGKLSFNGEPINDASRTDIIAACHQAQTQAQSTDIMQKPKNILTGE